LINFPDQQAVLLLDVREPNEFLSWRLPDSVNLPLSQLKTITKDTLKSTPLAKVKKKTPIITLCTAGMRSLTAVQLLSKIGFKQVWSLSGGLSKIPTQ
jgi:rhodanese-related sulfurtransferase